MARPVSPSAICTSLLVKLAMRCNIACTYCYWFRDAEVMRAPALLSEEIEDALVTKIERHLVEHELDEFSLTFHGGEPLLFPKRRFAALCKRLREVQARTAADLRLHTTTNGILLDSEWVSIFRDHDIRVALSIDGAAATHDRRRLDLYGRGTWTRALQGLDLLRAGGLEPGILAVCDPNSAPDALVDALIDDLGVRSLDVLVGDATHEDPRPPSVGEWYCRLFDRWYDDLAARDVEIRLFSGIIRALLGATSGTQSLGVGGITTATLTTTGALEALDVLRITGDGSTRSLIDIRTHELQDVDLNPLWREVLLATSMPPTPCSECSVRAICGGGHVASRWSNNRRLDNSSVYCKDYKEIIAHVWSRIAPDLIVELPAKALALLNGGPGREAT